MGLSWNHHNVLFLNYNQQLGMFILNRIDFCSMLDLIGNLVIGTVISGFEG